MSVPIARCGAPNFPEYLEDNKLINLESEALFNYISWRRGGGNSVPEELKLYIPQDQILVSYIDAELWSPGVIGSRRVNGFGINYDPVAVVSLEANSRDFHFVTAHETGHIVTKWDHPESAFPERLMYGGLDMRYQHEHKDSKRLIWDEIKRIRTIKHFYALIP